MTTATIYIERWGLPSLPASDEQAEMQELEIEITGSYTREVPARLNCHPDKSSPAEGGETEIEEAICKTEQYKHLFDALTSGEEEKACEAIREAVEDDFGEPEPDYDDDYYDGD